MSWNCRLLRLSLNAVIETVGPGQSEGIRCFHMKVGRLPHKCAAGGVRGGGRRQTFPGSGPRGLGAASLSSPFAGCSGSWLASRPTMVPPGPGERLDPGDPGANHGVASRSWLRLRWGRRSWLRVRKMPGSQGALVAREKAKLRKVLRRFNLVLFTACAIVGLDSVSFAAQAGAQAITWLAISLVLFLIPYGMLAAELGSAFPAEGGPYEWVKMSFGRLVGSVTAVLYWLTNPIWIGGTLAATAIATLNDFVMRKPLGTAGEIVVGLAFTWITVAFAIIAFRYGKWAPNIGTFVKIAVVGIFTILFIVFLARHGRPAGVSGRRT